MIKTIREAYRSLPPLQENERQGLGVLAAGAAAVGAIIFAVNSGGGHEDRYDVETEAALQHSIRPAMVRVAKTATETVTEHPGKIDPQTGLRANYGYGEPADKVRIVLTNNMLGMHRRIDVVMGKDGQNGQPDPSSVEYVETNVNFKDPNGDTTLSSAYLSAPRAFDRDATMVDTDDHPAGWSAGSVGSVESLDTGYVYDSSNSDFFSSDISFNPTDPVATAKYVVSHNIVPDYRQTLHP